MKRLLFLLLFPLAVFAAPGTAIVTFNPPTLPGDEYVVEEKQKDGSWVEVAKGPTSPITFPTNLVPGTMTIRVRARWLGQTPALVGPPSEEASDTQLPGAPGNPNLKRQSGSTSSAGTPTTTSTVQRTTTSTR